MYVVSLHITSVSYPVNECILGMALSSWLDDRRVDQAPHHQTFLNTQLLLEYRAITQTLLKIFHLKPGIVVLEGAQFHNSARAVLTDHEHTN